MRMADAHNDGYGQLVIEDGRIREVIWTDPPEDPGSRVLMPAFTDLHVHFRDPGMTHKEDLESGMKAALAGGYTDVQLMGNTKPVTSTMEQAEDILLRARALDLIDVHPCLSITRDFDGKDLSHLKEAGPPVVMLTDDGYGVADAKTMFDAMRIAAETGLRVTLHEEEPAFTKTDMRLAEDVMTLRDLYLSDVTGCPTHFAHVSTKQAIAWIRAAKAKTDRITCEVTPHHLILWDHDYRVNPPIRQKEDVDALRAALSDGTVDAIATDHAPHTRQDKEAGAPGMTGLEPAFALCYTHLVRTGIVSLRTLLRLLAERPAELMGLNQGLLVPGMDADLTVADLSAEWTVEPERFYSGGKNTPFTGARLFGRIVETRHKGVRKFPFHTAGKEESYDY